MHRQRWLSAGALAALALSIAGGAGAANAAPSAHAEPPPYTLVFVSTSVTAEYGSYWSLQANADDAGLAFGPFVVSGTLTNTPSGYAPSVSTYMPSGMSSIAYMGPSSTARPLGPGSYTATMTLSPFNGTQEGATTNPPATVVITPAALGIALQVAADPSNPANAIVSARFTGTFADSFFSTADPLGPLTPAGTWKITVTDAEGTVAHELTAQRTDQDDVLGISSYWSDVPPGEYTARAAFVPTGASADNFTIADAAPATYTAASAPGSGSTAPPAPPAPPPTQASGMTLPVWIPIAAGVLTAGLLALLIVQIVRLRRLAAPAAPTQVAA